MVARKQLYHNGIARLTTDFIGNVAFDCRICYFASVPSHSKQPLDETSRTIVEQLQADGRRSYAAIGKTVGMSEAAVRQRVQKLVDGGVLQIVAVVDPKQVGFLRQAMVGVRCSGDARELGERLSEIPEVKYVVQTAGSFDVLAEIVCVDDAELLDVLGGRIRALPGVVATETFVYLKITKEQYTWGKQ